MTILRLLPVLLLAGCATRSAIQESEHYANLGDYGRAYYVLDEVHKEQTRDGGAASEELEAAWQNARLAWMLYHAESQLFEENENGALATLVELENLAPDYPGIAGVRARAVDKKAKRLVRKGEENLVRKDYVQALALFLEAESLQPGLADAAHGIKEVWDATERMSKRAQTEFLEAVRKMPELRFIEAQWHANNVVHNAPDRDDAKQIESKMRRENALKSMNLGRDCERIGRFGAALIHYRIAKLVDPTTPGVDDAIAQMRKEQQATVLIDKAQIAMRAGRFDDTTDSNGDVHIGARRALAEAYDLSLMARNDIGALQMQVKKLEGQRAYMAARDLEVLGKKSEARAAYEALSKDWPEGYSDEKARIDSLQVDLDGAAAEWAEAEAAEAAGDLQGALDHYVRSERYYAGWKDGKERIVRLRAALPPKPDQKADPKSEPKAEGKDQGSGQGSGPKKD